MGITLAAGDATWDPANGYAKSEYETLRRNANGSAHGRGFRTPTSGQATHPQASR